MAFQDPVDYGLVGSIDGRVAELEKDLVGMLQKLDMSLNEAKILLHLMIYSNSTAAEVAKRTGIGRTEVYHYLSALLAKGIVHSTFDRPQKYYSLPYPEVVDILVKIKQDALNTVMGTKEEYHHKIRRIIDSRVAAFDDGRENYQVIVGEDALNAKIQRMLSIAKRRVIMVSSDKMLVSLYHAGVLDRLKELHRAGTTVRLLATSEKAKSFIKFNDGESMKKFGVSLIPNDLCTNYIVVDGSDALIMPEKPERDHRVRAFYTNSQSMISILSILFDKLPDSALGA